MEMSSGSARCARCQTRRGWIIYLLLLASAAIVAAGCSKKSETPSAGNTPPMPATQSTSATTPPDPAVNSQPAPPLPVTNMAAAPNAAPDLTALNMALRQWLMRNRRTPANFEEFAATAGVAIPPPPAGKKYAITKRMEVVLVDR